MLSVFSDTGISQKRLCAHDEEGVASGDEGTDVGVSSAPKTFSFLSGRGGVVGAGQDAGGVACISPNNDDS